MQIGEIAAAIALAAATAACARHYTTTGLVLKVDQPSSTVTISHDAFPGFMDAMVMPFGLEGGARRVALTPGDLVRFRLAVKRARSSVDRVEVISAAPVDAGLQQTPVVPSLVHVGAPVPDFELIDQSGRTIRLSSLAGKVVAVTFIYTRCPLPDYCPRMVENFRAIGSRFADRMNADLVFLTVSFDPKYDTTTGLVLKVDRPSSTVTISHNAFPGFMDAMVTVRPRRRRAARRADAGRPVRFRLAVKRARSSATRSGFSTSRRRD